MVENGEIVQHKQYLYFPQCYRLIIQDFAKIVSKLFAADVLFVGKGLIARICILEYPVMIIVNYRHQ